MTKRELYNELLTLYRELAKRDIWGNIHYLPFRCKVECVDECFNRFMTDGEVIVLDDYPSDYTYEKILKRHTKKEFENEIAKAKERMRKA